MLVHNNPCFISPCFNYPCFINRCFVVCSSPCFIICRNFFLFFDKLSQGQSFFFSPVFCRFKTFLLLSFVFTVWVYVCLSCKSDTKWWVCSNPIGHLWIGRRFVTSCNVRFEESWCAVWTHVIWDLRTKKEKNVALCGLTWHEGKKIVMRCVSSCNMRF